MGIKFRILAAIAAVSVCHGLLAQDAGNGVFSVVTMAEALEEASSAGDDFRLVSQTIGVARLQRSLDVAKQGVTVSVGGAYSVVNGIGEDTTSAQQSLISKAESASGSAVTVTAANLAQIAQGSVALSTPLTKVTINASHTLPPASSASLMPSSIFGVSGTQTVWDGYPGGQFSATLEKSNLTLQGKESLATQGYSSAQVKVKQAYITMLAAQRDLDIKKQVLDKQNKLLAQIQAVYALRQAADVDLKTAQINARTAEIDVATADKTLRLANERLAVILGRPGEIRFSVADIPDPALPAASIDEAIKIGLSKRSDLTQYEISARSSSIDAVLARAQAQPVISLTGGAGVSILWSSDRLSAEALSVGAKVTLPVVDSGAADFQAKTSNGQAALYSLQAVQLKKTIASDIRDYFETMQLLAEKVDLAKQSADLADVQFELMKTQNTYGTATTQDVLTASVTAATAEVNYGTARNAYLLGELNLETAMGL